MAAKYGNSGGRNAGKKYAKLRGDEMATPESEGRAIEFMKWFGDNFNALRTKLLYKEYYDDQVATDTALHLYDCILLKGLVVENYKWYYLRAYHTALLASKVRRKDEVLHIEDSAYDTVASSNCDYSEYERASDQLQNEILEYVRGAYDPISVSLFEIYVALQPDMSYNKLSAMLGIPATKIWPVIGLIRKDVAARFAEKHNILLSLL